MDVEEKFKMQHNQKNIINLETDDEDFNIASSRAISEVGFHSSRKSVSADFTKDSQVQKLKSTFAKELKNFEIEQSTPVHEVSPYFKPDQSLQNILDKLPQTDNNTQLTSGRKYYKTTKSKKELLN